MRIGRVEEAEAELGCHQLLLGGLLVAAFGFGKVFGEQYLGRKSTSIK